jgi:hypothetical protein
MGIDPLISKYVKKGALFHFSLGTVNGITTKFYSQESLISVTTLEHIFHET